MVSRTRLQAQSWKKVPKDKVQISILHPNTGRMHIVLVPKTFLAQIGPKTLARRDNKDTYYVDRSCPA